MSLEHPILKSKPVRFPIKYKFLGVLIFIVVASLGVFFTLSYRDISEDKKLFVMDLNMSVLTAAKSEVKSALKSRLNDIQTLAPRLYNASEKFFNPQNAYLGVDPGFQDEFLGMRFYKKKADGPFELVKTFNNKALIEKESYPENILDLIQESQPLDLGEFDETKNIALFNRSLKLNQELGKIDLPVLTIVVSARFAGSEEASVYIETDLNQSFLKQKLQQSELAELILLDREGRLLSHPSMESLLRFSGKNFDHPVTAKFSKKILPRESFELPIGNEDYLINIGETEIPDVFLISQIKKSQAFLALWNLMRKSSYVALLILCLSTILSVWFSGRLTGNIKKLKNAAEAIGNGNLDVELRINSNDELRSVSDSFDWMAKKIAVLMQETANKARMESELQTARLVQSTVLTFPEIKSDSVKIASHFESATECGGDFWEASFSGSTLTVVIADATGHGAAAALITAIAKSSLATLNAVYYQEPLNPQQFLGMLNRIIYETAKGQLLMTMCIVQLDCETGELTISNAGHEAPFCLKNLAIEDGKKAKAEMLFARGERLGFSAEADFKSEKFQLGLGDSLLLYTDGISEAYNNEGKEWGERALKKAFAGKGPRDVDQIKDEIIQGLKGHTQGAVQKDDITFVLVQWAAKISLGETVKRVRPASAGVEKVA